MFLQISSISNSSRIKMRFKKLRFSKSSFLKRVLLMTSQSHDHVVKIIFYDMNLKAPTIIYKTCARNKLYLLYFSHSYTTKRRRKTQKMSSIVYIYIYIYLSIYQPQSPSGASTETNLVSWNRHFSFELMYFNN